MSKHKVFFPKVSIWRQHHTGYGKEKKNYLSLEEANTAAAQRSDEVGYRLDAYRCPRCLLWHLGRHRKRNPLSTAEFLDIELELGIRVAANIKDELCHPFGSIKQRYSTCIKYALRNGERRAA